MADDSIYGFGSDDVRRIGSAVAFVERDARYNLTKRKYPIGGSGGSQLVCGRLTSTMTPATNGRTDPTSFTFKKWTGGDGNGGELDEDADNTTGWNRSTVLNASSGGFVVCSRINGEWIPVYVEEVC